MGSKLSVQNGHSNGASSGRSGTGNRQRQRTQNVDRVTSNGYKSRPNEDTRYSGQPTNSSGQVTRRSSPATSSSMCSYSTASTSQSSYPSEMSRPSHPSQHPSTPPPRRPRPTSHRFTSEQQRRILNAERILGEIAKEYAVKRAAGLVPTIPVPARTLLWEEMARNATSHVAKRGQCVFGRDGGTLCGCTIYQKKRMTDQNPGGICACCQHGGAWHRLQGGSNLRSTRVSWRSSRRYSRVMSDVCSREDDGLFYSDSEEEEESESESDEEAIANEVARPYAYTYGSIHNRTSSTHNSASLMHPRTSIDRSSFFSTTSSFGFPTRLSSGTMSVQTLMKAIESYRQQGMNEEEIEQRIQQEFPPFPLRLSTVIGPPHTSRSSES